MYEDFKTYVSQHRLFTQNDRILVAVSGGRDSMALLDCLLHTGVYLEVAHINYHLRAQASDQDEQLVSAYCDKHNIRYHILSTDLNTTLSEQHQNLQALAREVRYTYFEEIVQLQKLDLIAIAHHMDDRIENYFISSLRGTGLRGITSMKNKNAQIIRPLLFATRNLINQHLKTHDIPYRDDASNEESKYQRNFLRNKIFPVIQDKINDYQIRMLRTMANLDADAELFFHLIEEKKAQLSKTVKGHVVISLQDFKNDPKTVNLYYHLLSPYGLNQDQVYSLLTANTGTRIKTTKYEVLKDRSLLIIRAITNHTYRPQYISNTDLPTTIYSHHLSIINPTECYYNDKCLYLDYQKLEFPLLIRQWEPGDTFKPYGLEGKAKKVKDFLTNKKLSSYEKEDTLVLCSGSDIAAIIGLEVNYHWRVLENSTQILKIQ